MRILPRLVLSLCLIFSLAACQSNTATHVKPKAASHGKAHWDYSDGHHGPAHWAELDCPDCAGKSQSPIDIPASATVKAADITFMYLPSSLNIVNNGHTIKLSSDKKSAIRVNGKIYKLLQWHFHAPSEHEIAGKSFPMEMHLVHQSDAGEYAVVGVMIQQGEHNTAFDSFWGQMPKHAGDPHADMEIHVNAINLLPENRDYYNYSGSFTTPPCTEGVNWLLLKTPISLSASQIAKFTALYDHNNRPIQPVNGRF